MNITTVNASPMQGIVFPFENSNEVTRAVSSRDIVDVNELPDMSDEEVESLLQDTLRMIGDDSVNALSVHSGLDPNRVFALLGLA